MSNPLDDPKQILRARAKALARTAERAPAVGATIEVLEFALAKERYAMENRHVTEVCPLKDLTPLPCTPPFLRGIVNVRGRILPVLDLKKFFELPETGLTDLHCIILVRGKDIELGVLADAIATARTIPVAAIQPPLPTLTGIREDYLRGVTAEHLILLDMDRILSDPKIVVNEEVEP